MRSSQRKISAFSASLRGEINLLLADLGVDTAVLIGCSHGGKIVLNLAGANHGIGAAMAKAFAAQGAKVFISYFRGDCALPAGELAAAGCGRFTDSLVGAHAGRSYPPGPCRPMHTVPKTQAFIRFTYECSRDL